MIESAYLKNFACTQQASIVLPQLIRFLIYETSAIEIFEMPIKSGMNRPGPDGYIRAIDGNAWVPKGDSLWEMSTERDVSKKAISDFRKRTNEVLTYINKPETEFVFVTLRQWNSKKVWEQKCKNLGVWKNVRSLDADDIEAWLCTAPKSISVWLETQMHLTGMGREVLGKFENPYPGLRPFREKDRDLFFGREGEVKRIVDNILNCMRGNSFKILVVTGRSGVGKSSLISAGILPELLARSTDKKIYYLTIRPADFIPTWRDHLGSELARTDSILSIDGRHLEVRDVVAILHRDGGLYEIICGLQDRMDVVIFIDQIEEIFISLASPEQRKDLFSEILLVIDHANRRRSRGLIIIAALRSDYYERFFEESGWLNSQFSTTTLYSLDPPGRDHIRAIIEKPAALLGVEISNAIFDRIIDDMNHAPGFLPLLAYSLEDTFSRFLESHDIPVVTMDHYQGLQYLIDTRAEEAFTEIGIGKTHLNRAVIENAVFGALTVFSIDGCSRRRAAIGDLETGCDHDKVANIIALLVNKRIAVSHNNYIELAHDSVLLHWKSLEKWISRHSEYKHDIAALSSNYERWISGGKDDSLLIPDGRMLEQAIFISCNAGYLVDAKMLRYIEASRILSMNIHRKRTIVGFILLVIFAILLFLSLISVSYIFGISFLASQPELLAPVSRRPFI